MPTRTGEPEGLRERKKSLAKQALEQAALTLFTEHGYEETTVEDIAAAAGVSKASFFRYFPAKEDVMSHQGELQRTTFMHVLSTRPDGEPVLASLQAAIHEYAEGLDESARERSAAYAQVIVGSRPLLGRAFEIRTDWLHDLRLELERRLGTPPGTEGDVLPTLLAGITLSVLETALWRASTEPATDFDAVINQGFALIRADIVLRPLHGPVVELDGNDSTEGPR